jgi:hypothetical protein
MSGGITVKVVLTGKDTLVSRFRNAPTALMSRLKSDLLNLALDMRDQAAAAAGGRTGRLANSITAKVTATNTSVAVNIGTDGVPYAEIQEEGGHIPGHEILPTAAQALAFNWIAGGGAVDSTGQAIFARVSWPGADIRPKHYILNTLKANRANFNEVIQKAINDTLQDVVA